MNFPSKVTPYGRSVIAVMLMICKESAGTTRAISPRELVARMARQKVSVRDVMNALDILFALGNIRLEQLEGGIRYVG